jgi:hypothetical protein
MLSCLESVFIGYWQYIMCCKLSRAELTLHWGTDNTTTHDIANLEVGLGRVRMFVVAGNTHRGNTGIGIDSREIFLPAKRFSGVVVLALIFSNLLQALFFCLGFWCILLVDRPQRLQRITKVHIS